MATVTIKNINEKIPKTFSAWVPGSTMSITKEPLLLSLKPHYAELLFVGLKTAELRRRIPHIEDRDVFIYVSSPVRELRGGFHVEHVWSGTPQHVWNKVSQLAGVKKREFDAYYMDQTIAYALKIDEVWEYANPVSLDKLRNRFPGFVVPQSWRYVRPDEHRSFRNMKKQKISLLRAKKHVVVSGN